MSEVTQRNKFFRDCSQAFEKSTSEKFFEHAETRPVHRRALAAHFENPISPDNVNFKHAHTCAAALSFGYASQNLPDNDGIFLVPAPLETMTKLHLLCDLAKYADVITYASSHSLRKNGPPPSYLTYIPQRMLPDPLNIFVKATGNMGHSTQSRIVRHEIIDRMPHLLRVGEMRDELHVQASSEWNSPSFVYDNPCAHGFMYKAYRTEQEIEAQLGLLTDTEREYVETYFKDYKVPDFRAGQNTNEFKGTSFVSPMVGGIITAALTAFRLEYHEVMVAALASSIPLHHDHKYRSNARGFDYDHLATGFGKWQPDLFWTFLDRLQDIKQFENPVESHGGVIKSEPVRRTSHGGIAEELTFQFNETSARAINVTADLRFELPDQDIKPDLRKLVPATIALVSPSGTQYIVDLYIDGTIFNGRDNEVVAGFTFPGFFGEKIE
ncbi:MAG TPA: hypothetical protein PLK94_09415, partial [Alphaproteobacteria bacterium]|nr:hypothetical protein [Alphaproteobacteria bacterium]